MFFSILLERYNSVVEVEKTIFGSRYGLLDFMFLFLVKLGTCVQNIIFTKVVEGCQIIIFPQRDMQKLKYKARFLPIERA
jgi:hypothetical protein